MTSRPSTVNSVSSSRSPSGSGSWGAEYDRYYIPIQPGDTYVTFSYDRFGESVELQIPLPEVTP